AVLTPLASVPRSLEAAERNAHVPRRTVDRHPTGADPAPDAIRTRQVARPDVCMQAVRSVIGDPHRILLVAIGQDRQHGSEDLFTGDDHVIVDIGEYGGPDEVAFLEPRRAPLAAGHEVGALADAFGNVALHTLELELRYQRAHRSLLRRGVADDGRFGSLFGQRLDLRQAGGGHEQPRGCIAGLAGVLENVPYGSLHRALQIGILQHNTGGLAAELLMYALDRRGRDLRDLGAGTGRAGEGDHIDVGVGGQRRADFRTRAIDEIEHAGRDSGLVQDLRPDRRAEGGELRGLQHHGAAGRERGNDFRRDLVHRPVPWRDQGADADWLEGEAARAAALLELERLQKIDHRRDVSGADAGLRPLGEADRSSHLVADRGGDVQKAFLVDREHPLEQRAPLLPR